MFKFFTKNGVETRKRVRKYYVILMLSTHHCSLTVLRHRRSTLGRRAFSVAGPAV